MRQARGGWLLVGTAVLAMAAAGCREPRDNREATTETGAAQAGNTDLHDGWITTKVQAKYFTEPDVRGRDIDVTTSDGVVTLSGVVENEQARQRAIEIARNTDGVAGVQDHLHVGTADAATADGRTGAAPAPAPGTGQRPQGDAARTDRDDDTVGTAGGTEAATQVSNAWVTTKIQGQYFADAVVRGRGIDVTTNNGVVTLTGDVESERERQRAVEIAKATDGVRRVEDQLRVTAPASGGTASGATAGEDASAEGAAAPTSGSGAAFDEQRSDAGITTRVQSKFFTDDQVRARNINVTTENQVVTLEGTVRTDAERQRALSLARSVDGVRSVEDRLNVEGTSGGMLLGDDESGAARSATDGVDDAWITTKIQAKYFVDDLVRGSRVDVSTQRGVVTLSGEVRSEEEKRRAEELARSTEGATKVENRLQVNPSAAGVQPREMQPPTDPQPVQELLHDRQSSPEQQPPPPQ